MKRFALSICLAACLAFLCGSPAWGFVNNVVIESKTILGSPGVNAATPAALGIFLENDIEVVAFVMPLDVRALYNNGMVAQSFWSALAAAQPSFVVGNRAEVTNLVQGASVTKRTFPAASGGPCSGPVSNTYSVSGAVNFISPDGIFLAAVSQASDPPFGMAPGADPGSPGPGGSPSVRLSFTVGAFDGPALAASAFIIDTGCVTPANHLSYVDPSNVLYAPIFTPGIVLCSILANQCPGTLTVVPDPVNATVGVEACATFGGTDADPLRFCMRSGPGAVDLLTGRWCYTPTCADIPGFDVCVEVFDDQHSCGACDTKCVHVNVASVPLALSCGTGVSVHWAAADASQLLSAAGGCPPYTYSMCTAPPPSGPGGIDPGPPVKWTYDQGCADVGSATVRVCVRDDVGATDDCEFTLTVTNNDVPSCPGIADSTIAEGQSKTYVLGPLFDGDGDALTYDTCPGVGYATGWPGEGIGTDANPDVAANEYFTGVRPAGDTRAAIFFRWQVSDGCVTVCCDPGIGINFKTPCVAIYGEVGSWAYYSTTLSGRNKTVYIVAEPGSIPDSAGGFDFLICYDQSGLTFLNAAMGPDVAGLGLGLHWEYFTYRTGMFGGNCGGGCPDGYVKIVGIADMNNGIPLPDANFDINGKVLASLTFFVTSDRNFINSCLHVGFCSYDCGDNVISSKDGYTTWLADGGVITGPDYGRPIRCDTCLYDAQGRLKNCAVPAITYCPGAICVIPPPDDRGDINLNGIANEIGDAVLYTNYFIYGQSVWDATYKEAQILASDINNDGIVLTVADLIYLIRIVTGDAQPFANDLPNGSPKLSPYANSVDVLTDVSNSILNVRTSTSVELGAAMLVYRYDGMAVGTPVLSAGTNLRIKSRASNGELRILVWGESRGAKVPAGANNLVSVPVVGNGTIELVESQFSDYDGALLTVNAAGVARPTSYALLQNYPNPFNAGTVIPIQLSSESDWTLTVYNVAGQVVRSYMGHDGAGTRNVAWDGRDESGSAVASGMYFYRATAKDFTAVKKMVLMK